MKTKEAVGASIMNIITESLYDKPIVVFREYIQNSADSFLKCPPSSSQAKKSINIWSQSNCLFFLDNGSGISRDKFESKMTTIASSDKIKISNIGYKGIGRLSGISYCENLSFVNIESYTSQHFQEYHIDCKKYNELKKTPDFSSMGFGELMNNIGCYTSQLDEVDREQIVSLVKKHEEIFKEQDTGFLVVLEGISSIFKQTLAGQNILDDLGWLLPVPFSPELQKGEYHELFEELYSPSSCDVGHIPAKGYDIFFNDTQILRPIKSDMLRDYVCKCNLNNYAVCVHSFPRNKISVDQKNPFRGIRIYIDNVLLCDERELLPILQQYGLIEHTANELIQTVKGIGAMIYIVDKVNISANARRTFIEISDGDSFDFLKLLAEFVNNIFDARYALSRYASAQKDLDCTTSKLSVLKDAALAALRILAREKIAVEDTDNEAIGFNELSETEQKRLIKKKITRQLQEYIKSYLSQLTTNNLATAEADFKTWLVANLSK